jgi:hypothetical protein
MARYVAPVSKTRFPAGEDPISGRRRPDSGHRRRDARKVSGRAGARGPICSPGIEDPISSRRRPDFRPAKTRLRPPLPGLPKSCWACWGTWPDVLLFSMTRFPASGDPFPAGEDPFPPTASGPPARLSGALGLLLRGEGVAFICRARAEVRQPQRAPHRGWRPGRSGSCLSLQAGGPADVPDVERHRRGSRLGCSRRGRGIKLPGSRPCVGPPRDP